MLRAAAEKTGEIVGDVTSTATILAHAILADGHRNVTAGANAIDGTVGFDAARNRYVDLLEEGIIDLAKVVRVALENAVSVASVLLLTEATMTEIPEVHVPQLPAPAI